MKSNLVLLILVATILFLVDASIAGEKQVNVKLHDPQMLWSDGSWRGLSATKDGKLFMSFCSHWIDRNACALSYDPATQKFSPLFDLKRVSKIKTGPEGVLSHGKIHTPFFEKNDTLYFATHFGPVGFKTINQRKPYPGGCFLAFDRKKGKARVVGRAPENEGIMTLEADFPRNCLYGVTYPSGRLLRCDITNGKVTDLGVTDSEIIEAKGRAPYVEAVRCLVVHPDTGVVYGSRKNGLIWQYDPAVGKITDTGLNVQQGIVGEADEKAKASSMWRMAVLSSEKDKIYATHRGTTSLFEYDLKNKSITPLVRLCTDTDLGGKGNKNASRLAFELKDGVIHHLAHGKAVAVEGRKKKPRYQAHYVTYDLATKKRTDHGPLMAPEERRVVHTDTLAILPDGRLFSLAFVEIIDPIRIWKLKTHGRGMGAYHTLAGVYFEMQLVELPKIKYKK